MSEIGIQEIECPRAIICLQAPPMKTRVKKVHSKVKTGCATCRQRRIKCGEQRPNCLQCTRGGRTCPGYQKPKVWLFEPFRNHDLDLDLEPELARPQPPPSSSPFRDAEGSRAFQYYFEVSEPPMARFFASALTPVFQHHSRADDANKVSSMFWAVTFPRLVCAEPVLAMCLLVLVTAHERVQSSNCPFAQEPNCLEKFVEAITILRKEWNNMSVDCILIASMLLAVAELSFGPTSSGLSHLYAGSRIIRQRRAHPEHYAHHRSSPEIENIRESTELLYEAFFANVDLRFDALMPHSECVPTKPNIPRFWLPLKFSSTQQALGSLESVATAARAMIRHKTTHIDQKSRISLRRNAESWLGAFQDLETELNCTTDPGFLKACLVIRIHGLTTLLMSSIPSSELNYDRHKAEFQQIADFAEEFLKLGGGMTQSVKAHLIFSAGPVNPIFFAATKCRFAPLRKRLLHALRRLKVVEGGWTSCAAYQVARQVAAIESQATEDSPHLTTTAWSDRITLDSVVFGSADQVTLEFHQESFTGNSFTKSASIQPCRHQEFLNKGNVVINEFGCVRGFVEAVDCECEESYKDSG